MMSRVDGAKGTMHIDIANPLLFEIAWEVANKVGGIYTVLKSKAPVTCNEYGSRYCLIGPLNAKTAPMEVEAIDVDKIDNPSPVVQSLINLKKKGVNFMYGRWLVEGAPLVILFDIGNSYHRMNEWKSDLWNIAGIPSPPDDTETNEAIIFGYLTSWFLGELIHNQKLQYEKDLQSHPDPVIKQPAVIAHFHEWLAGVALVLTRKRSIPISTIFTTHATLLGRYLCAGDVDFYNNLKYFDVDAEAGKRGIYHRYCIERAAAHCADVFTTVSHITAYEAEWLLKRKPDGILPNGLSVVKFSALHEFQNLHAQAKEKIHDFVRGHFYGHKDFDLDNTIYFFTAGRYEYRNKGVDMFIESLARLNARLKAYGSSITVVAFIIMPAKTHSYSVEALKGQAVMKQLRDTVTEVQNSVGSRIFEMATNGKLPPSDKILNDQELVLLKRRIYALKRDSLPPIVTHNMADDMTDPILNQIRKVQLFNKHDDRVKVVFHPEFLNANNPLLGLDYEEFVRGCHLGVFPSYYEPWGYTPAECTVMGVPSITSNLAGFGCFMEEMISCPSDYGIYIVDRRLKSIEESCDQLTDHMMDFCIKSRRQRINQRNRTERLSDLLDWKRMGLEYVKARWVAVRRKWPELVDQLSENLSDEEGSEAGGFYGYESDTTAGSLQRDDLSALGYHKKVPRPASAPGSPKINAISDFDDEGNSLFLDDPRASDEYEKETSKTGYHQRRNSAVLRGLKELAIKGTDPEYSPPVKK